MKPLFAYRTGHGFLHRMPALLKLMLLPPLSALLFFLPMRLCAVYCAAAAVFALCTGESVLQQLCSLKVLFPYAVLLFLTYVFSLFGAEKADAAYFVLILLRLTGALQTASLFFNTTTSFQLKKALSRVLPERLRLLPVLFLFFIPLLFSVWAKLETAWQARRNRAGRHTVFRGVKKNIGKFFVLLPVFISASFYKTLKLKYALQNRSGRSFKKKEV